MRNLVAALLVLAFALEARAADPLESFLRDVNTRAKKDMQAFHATVAAQFGVPEVQVRAVFGRVHDAADTFMVFQIGNMTQRPVNEVLPVYESHKGKGWGAIATAGVECRKDLDVIDETPGAYKAIDDVMAAQADLVDIVHTLKQIVCVKG